MLIPRPARRLISAVGQPLAALAVSLALVALALAALGANPALTLTALANGAFGNWVAFTDTLVKATPLVFTGLTVSVAFSGALWNIGGEGQLLAGALAATACGIHVGSWPHPLAIATVLGVGTLAGAVWGGLSGWLRARYHVSEVISTIMLNYTAMQIVSWAVHGPLMEPSRSFPASAMLPAAARLVRYLPPSRLNAGMLLALALAPACYVWMFHTNAGFELRAMGKNQRAAAFFSIPVARITVLGMALSGALAGLGGAVQVSAITNRLFERFSPGWGYEAIAVALVARLNPLAIVPSALFFGALDNGAQAIQRAQGVSPVLVQAAQGLVIFVLLAFDTPAFQSWFGAMVSSAPAKAAQGQADA
ncbi:MAG: ABC transporter permease [Candidatus Binataceae bacterium]